MPPFSLPRFSRRVQRMLDILPSLIIGAGCVALASHAEPSANTTAPTDLFVLESDSGRHFQIEKTEASATRRKALFRLVDALDASYDALAFEDPKPIIRVVDRGHDRLPNHALAAAMVTESGREMVYFEREYLNSGAALTPLVIHELSHLLAWRQFGHDIAVHGPEFKAICRKASSRENCTTRGRYTHTGR